MQIVYVVVGETEAQRKENFHNHPMEEVLY